MSIDIKARWTYRRPLLNAIPEAGQAVQSTETIEELWFNKIDVDLNDWGTELLAVTIGKEIDGAGQRWTVTGTPVDNTTWVSMEVTPLEQGAPGTATFHFGDEPPRATGGADPMYDEWTRRRKDAKGLKVARA